MPIEILMPSLSPTMKKGKLLKWHKQEGDKINPGEVLFEVESDKANMEVESTDEGILGKIVTIAGTDNVDVNSIIGLVLEEGEDEKELENYISTTQSKSIENKDQQEELNFQSNSNKDNNTEPVQNTKSDRIFASPLAKKIASQENIDLSNVRGTGPRNRIVKRDIDDYIANPDHELEIIHEEHTINNIKEDDTLIPVTNMRKVIGERLLESKQTIPHFYLTIDCILDNLISLKSKITLNKLSVNDFIIKACAIALKNVPEVNSSWEGENIRRYSSVDVSVAVAIEDGLITPIIKNADLKSISQISREMKILAEKARNMKLSPDEFQGGGFTITNLGMYGIKNFIAIVNPPQSCILSVGSGKKAPIVKDDKVIIANIMEITLSCDHRIIDGVIGAKFLNLFKNYIEAPENILI